MADSPIISVLSKHQERYYPKTSQVAKGANNASPAYDTNRGDSSAESVALGRMAAEIPGHQTTLSQTTTRETLEPRETPEEWYIRMGIL